MLPQRTAGGLPLRGCFLRGRRGIILPAFFMGGFFPLLVFAKQGHFSCWFCGSSGIFSAFCPTAGGGFFLRVLSSRQIFPSADFSKWQDIFPVDFAGQAGFLSGLLPLGKAVSLSPILANGGAFFPLILQVGRDFYSAFCHSAGGGFFLRVLFSRQIFPSAGFCKARTFFPLILRVKRDFYSAFCPSARWFPSPRF